LGIKRQDTEKLVEFNAYVSNDESESPIDDEHKSSRITNRGQSPNAGRGNSSPNAKDADAAPSKILQDPKDHQESGAPEQKTQHQVNFQLSGMGGDKNNSNLKKVTKTLTKHYVGVP